ncbi:hypothetical protein ABZS66_24195 [Dactylosporangium sp. NPDC005572]|uniref:hypothetical protein n=1 Tax=Dactylosporangium sp. NPDC005572 TaxID=3156889 RepID=UPI0033AD0BAC
MTSDGELLAAFVVGACPDVEGATVAEHLDRCAACAAEAGPLRTAAEWLGELAERRPPRELRARVLTAARAARPPGDAEVDRLLAPYAAQVAAFDRLLGALDEPHWLRPAGPHATVRDLVVHLRANDATVAGAPGVLTPDVRRGWRSQTEVLVRTVAGAGRAGLDRPVPLAGRAPLRRPLREALTQRAFETWIHADDVRAVLGLVPEVPNPEQLMRIADFALRLLPGALDAAGRGRPHQVVRLTLTGAERLVTLSAATPATGSTVVAEIALSTERFCRLVAGRLTPPAGAAVTGDTGAALDFLAVAATMGCD